VEPLRQAVSAGARVVVVDDIITTGATLVAVSDRLRGIGVRVDRCAVLAATRRRLSGNRPEARDEGILA
jgi:predicted amidophosphoribosyltransferase